ncbi:porin [Mesorhizobium shangrilense]|uniref:Porin n=1 Tax=Mesorhizobium shangrilense TaxID=460060 RepID=A0ABV2DM23_9HYPH
MKQGIVLRGVSTLLFNVPYVYAANTAALADPEPDQYVRVCDAMGAGFLKLPGSETCLKIGGYVSYEVTAGADVNSGERKRTWSQQTKAALRADTQSQTELGILRTYIEIEDTVTDGIDEGAALSEGMIGLNGLQVGASGSQFDSWLGSAGNVPSDDVVASAGGMTNQINYTASFGSGLSAMFGAEQGAKDKGDDGDGEDNAHDYTIDSYVPHLVGGLKFERNWGAIATVVGYDSVIEGVAAKMRLDVQLGDTFSAFIMGGYQSDPEKPNYFGAWKGTYAAWGGISVSPSPKVTFNSQAAYEDSGTYALALNLDYEIAPGFIISPGLNYTSFDSDPTKPDDALSGIVSIQRDF